MSQWITNWWNENETNTYTTQHKWIKHICLSIRYTTTTSTQQIWYLFWFVLCSVLFVKIKYLSRYSIEEAHNDIVCLMYFYATAHFLYVECFCQARSDWRDNAHTHSVAKRHKTVDSSDYLGVEHFLLPTLNSISLSHIRLVLLFSFTNVCIRHFSMQTHAYTSFECLVSYSM